VALGLHSRLWQALLYDFKVFSLEVQKYNSGPWKTTVTVHDLCHHVMPITNFGKALTFIYIVAYCLQITTVWMPQSSSSCLNKHGSKITNECYKRFSFACLHDTRTLISCCSPTFNQMSNNQTVASWPAPGGITKTQATATCRAMIVNTTLIGQSCYDSIHNDQSATDIVHACVNDVQV